MAARILLATAWFFALTACRQEQPTLPSIERVRSTLGASDQGSTEPEVNSSRQQRESGPGVRSITDELHEPVPTQSCYSLDLLRSKSQRASAVQARLTQADRMTAAFDSHLLTVDLIGDHANILSLRFPATLPAQQSYADHVSSIVEGFFSSPEIRDYMCNSGFAEVRLSAWGLNDRRIHPIWKARVTSEGLLRVGNDREQLASSDPSGFH
jgi:hypothetical protein